MQFWPPDDEHMCSKHVEAWNKLIVKQKFCASSWLIAEIKPIEFIALISNVKLVFYRMRFLVDARLKFQETPYLQFISDSIYIYIYIYVCVYYLWRNQLDALISQFRPDPAR